MRISDWSSDVCSSDLPERVLLGKQRISAWPAAEMVHSVLDSIVSCSSIRNMVRALPFNRGVGLERDGAVQHEQIGGSDRCMRGSKIGRASCRERVCQYV